MRESINYKTQRLVTLAQAGDESALDRLCSVYGERVRRIVRMRMGKELRSKMESMDLVQDAFISALRSLESFTYQNEGDFLRWLSTIAENRLRDHVEKLHTNKRDIRKEIPLNNNGQGQDSVVRTPGPVALTTPSMIMSKREDLDKLEKAIDKLKPEYREVIVLAKIEGLSNIDIGKKLGKKPHAVCMLLSRAMTALADVFEDN
ncbi:MAG: sigma-70 family RNA polymerase sigma factor [Phycisphaerae bacterium]|nr:sigma-70 family RNA polymerase sigma factor [Phycisphaerae bacterium]